MRRVADSLTAMQQSRADLESQLLTATSQLQVCMSWLHTRALVHCKEVSLVRTESVLSSSMVCVRLCVCMCVCVCVQALESERQSERQEWKMREEQLTAMVCVTVHTP